MLMAQRVFAFCAVLLLAACATTTETNSTWQTKTGEARPSFAHLYVLVLSENAVASAAVEQQVKKSLAKRKVDATLASATLPAANQQAADCRSTVEQAGKESGSDGVKVITLLTSQERDECMPATVDHPLLAPRPRHLATAA